MAENNGTDDTPTDLIPLNEAAALVKPPRGKKTHLSTLIRWILSKKLHGWRRGRYWLVSRQELLAMTQPVQVIQPPMPETRKELDRRQQHVQAELKRLGFKKHPGPEMRH